MLGILHNPKINAMTTTDKNTEKPTEAAPNEEKAGKIPAIRTEEARLKAEADERAAAEEAGVVTREAQNSATKEKEVAAANEEARR